MWASDGRRFLTIRFSAYERLGLYWGVFAHLDSRGGARSEYVMRLFNRDLSGKGCEIKRRGHPWDSAKHGTFHQAGAVAKCHIPLKWVDYEQAPPVAPCFTQRLRS